MMTFEKLMNEFDDFNDNEEVMEKLTCLVSYFAEEVREHNPKLTENFLMKVDLLLNPHFTKETSEYAVHCMKNRDGTTGEHWNYETTSKVLESKNYDFHKADWYVALNMVYSDYYKSGRSDETYIDLASDFLDDPDAPKYKMKKYWRAMKNDY